MYKKIFNMHFPYFIGIAGGFIFTLVHVPLAWILGPMTFLIIWRSTWNDKSGLQLPVTLKNSSFIILGISFGLTFTKETFFSVGPYLFPFLLTTVLLILISILNGVLISKLVNIDTKTSIFASIPGGLSEMVAASESVKANTSLVAIFQTVRLLTVVFFVPFSVLHLFEPVSSVEQLQLETSNQDYYAFGWFLLSALAGWLSRNILPAAYVIAPLLTTALLNVIGIHLPEVHPIFLLFAQLTIGINFGLMITFEDLKKGGRYCGLYFLSTILLIVASFILGYFFTLLTNLTLPTAMLSLAPGGLVEMVLTASSIGADPAIVSSLQFIRLLFIISFVPSLLTYGLKKYGSRNQQKHKSHSA